MGRRVGCRMWEGEDGGMDGGRKEDGGSNMHTPSCNTKSDE